MHGLELPCSMGDLPGPGIEPASSSLAGGFLTPGPPGKSRVGVAFWWGWWWRCFFFAVLGLCCCGAAPAGAALQLWGMGCSARTQALGLTGFSSCGSWAPEHRLNSCGARPPRPWIEPVSPALAALSLPLSHQGSPKLT